MKTQIFYDFQKSEVVEKLRENKKENKRYNKPIKTL